MYARYDLHYLDLQIVHFSKVCSVLLMYFNTECTEFGPMVLGANTAFHDRFFAVGQGFVHADCEEVSLN